MEAGVGNDAVSGVGARLRALAAGEATAVALAEFDLARVAATDDTIEAWAWLDPAQVRAAAACCDAVPAAARGPLHGIGIGVKDIIATVTMPTQMGSPVHAGHRPAADAVCVRQLQSAGGYVFGKTVTTAYAYLDPGKTRNPWHPGHTPGGSSSGSAAAVAAGQVAAALGTQTNGSVIRPAAYCGVVGFKPTRGTIPLDGVHVFSETLDQVGVFARAVADAGLVASAVVAPGQVAARLANAPARPTIGYLAGFPWTRIDCETDERLDAVLSQLRSFADIRAIDLPAELNTADRTHRTIMLYEGACNLGPLQDRERARLSPKLNAALDEGRAITGADYAAALAARERARLVASAWLAGFDAIAAPPAPSAAPEGLGSTGDPACCTLWSLLGFPALTLPVALTAAGLPLGLQLAANDGDDDRLLALAACCEARLPFAPLAAAPVPGAR
jgi:Asp-tRNA(Asn)/Glu-tRNA(Gln) amidotransferase A subunit family amidase